MVTILCWSVIVIFIIYFSSIAMLLIADPDTMVPICVVSIILMGILTTVLLVLIMPI